MGRNQTVEGWICHDQFYLHT